MAIYNFSGKLMAGEVLASEIMHAGLPLPMVSVDADCVYYVSFHRDLKPEEETILKKCVEDHAPFIPRQLKDDATLAADVRKFVGSGTPQLDCLCVLLCEALKRDPQCCKRMGIPLEGDEPE